MNYVIVCVEKPKSRNLDEWNQWQPFSDALTQRPELTAGTQTLVENEWLFPLDNGLIALTGFLHLLQGSHLEYKYVVMDNQPKIFSGTTK